MAYVSDASNLVPGDTNGASDIFVVQIDVAPPVDGVVKDGDDGDNHPQGHPPQRHLARARRQRTGCSAARAMTGWTAVRATTRYLPARATIPCLAVQAMTGFGPARDSI